MASVLDGLCDRGVVELLEHLLAVAETEADDIASALVAKSRDVERIRRNLAEAKAQAAAREQFAPRVSFTLRETPAEEARA